MIERDYVMRMITMLVAALTRILARKQAKDYPGALQELGLAQKNLLGIDRELIARFSADQLMSLFGADHSMAVPRSYVLAVLMKEEAELRGLMGEDEESGRLSLRSLSLLLDTLRAGEKPVEERHTVYIHELLQRLRPYVLPVELLERVFWFQEQEGRFDRAEDLLFEILEQRPEFRTEAVRFYARLLGKEDAELEAGNLPRQEILDALDELQGGEKR